MTFLPEEPQAVSPAGTRTAGRRAIYSWYLFDWASQPVATLITTFVFAPYFVDYVAANEDAGTAQWGWALAAAGLVVAILSPILGAIADAAGRRKPWIAAFSLPLIVGSLLLWLAEPGADGAVIATLIGVFLATVGAEFAEVFTNAMMPSLVGQERMGRLSGSGWAIGYLGGMVALVIVIALFVAPPSNEEPAPDAMPSAAIEESFAPPLSESRSISIDEITPQQGEALVSTDPNPSSEAAEVNEPKTFVGLSPLFGLDPETYEGVRASGPLTALWYLVFVIPLFLFTPDTARVMAARKAIGIGWRNLRETLRHIRSYRQIVRYLIARMIYADGLAGLFAFGGVYATSTFNWGTTEFLLFGMLVIIAAIPGAFLGGRLDDRLGSKPIILASITILILTSVAALSITSDTIFFGIAVDPPVEGDGMYASAGERIYLLLGALIGLVAGPLQAASRTLIIRMSPKDQITQFTGMFALSGRLTTFAASAAVATVTTIADNQRLGISTLVLFFVVGGILLLRVDPTPAER